MKNNSQNKPYHAVIGLLKTATGAHNTWWQINQLTIESGLYDVEIRCC